MDIFSIAEFKTPAATAVEDLKGFLAQGMPANVAIGDVREVEGDKTLGLLHVIALSVQPNQTELAAALIDTLFQFGASWMAIDGSNRTPGCICLDRQIPELYEKFVRQGVTSEIFMKRMLEEPAEEPEEQETEKRARPDDDDESEKRLKPNELPEENQKDYLANKLEYTDNTLLTSQNDGVMMDWETPIMKRSAEIITTNGGSVLNVGFGMGIIDGFIQEREPAKHYIVEAHPDVLKKMRADGWYDKPNVVVLEGEWKKVLPSLLSQGITFTGIYYDTFSEHYSDLVEFFDLSCGLLDFEGVFSFFNGLGADRQIVYDVYKQITIFDLQDYGFEVEYEMIPVAMPKNTWEGIKRSYFAVGEYALPKIRFQS